MIFFFFPLLARLFSGWSLENSGDTLIAARRKLLSRQRIAFHLKSRDADGASFTEMMRGMHDFFAAIPTDKESLKQSLLAQIKVFTLCVGVVADKDMDDATFGAVMTVAGEGHGLIFLPPADLYTADGATVFNADGESDFDSWTVTAPAALLVPSKATASGEARKERSNKCLAAEGVPVCAALPPIVGDAAYLPRSVEEVARRTLGILLTSVFAELASSRGMEAARESIADLLERYGAQEFLSPGERAFISGPAPDEQSLADFTRRYECAWVGLWALGFVDTLAYPGAVCDAGSMAAMVRDCGDYPGFLRSCRLRAPSRILDEADRTYRYDWACVDARVNGRDVPAGLDPGVVVERHRMFNWLIRYMDADWDDVRTDT